MAAGANPTPEADTTLKPFGKQIQQQLKEAGHNINIDGMIGEETLDALLGYLDTLSSTTKDFDSSQEKEAVSQGIVEIASRDEYDKIIAQNKTSDKPLYIYFSADDCRYCEQTTPIYEEFSEKNKENAVFAKVHMSTITEVASTYGIRGTPTLQVFEGGEKAGGKLGVFNRETLEYYIDKAESSP